MPALSGATAHTLAEAVLILHVAFVLFVALGAALVWRWPRLAWLHLPAVAWGAYAELSGTVCPLTYLENHLLHLAQGAGYSGGFIEQHLLPLLYPGLVLTPEQARWIALAAGALTLLWNGTLYALLWRRRSTPALPPPPLDR